MSQSDFEDNKPSDLDNLIEVTDLKQYRYCPRVVYYRYHLPRLRPVTYKMEEGILGHQTEAYRESRRKLQLFDLPEGEKILDLRVSDPVLGLHGRLDLLIAIPDKANACELIPVEYKWSKRPPGPHFKLQIAAYAWLLQKNFNPSVKRGLIYQPLLRRTTEITLSSRLINQVPQTVEKVKIIRQSEKMPEPPRQAAPCLSCEFRRLCNDTL